MKWLSLQTNRLNPQRTKSVSKFTPKYFYEIDPSCVPNSTLINKKAWQRKNTLAYLMRASLTKKKKFNNIGTCIAQTTP